jgi:hypothetical protein
MDPFWRDTGKSGAYGGPANPIKIGPPGLKCSLLSRMNLHPLLNGKGYYARTVITEFRNE